MRFRLWLCLMPTESEAWHEHVATASSFHQHVATASSFQATRRDNTSQVAMASDGVHAVETEVMEGCWYCAAENTAADPKDIVDRGELLAATWRKTEVFGGYTWDDLEWSTRDIILSGNVAVSLCLCKKTKKLECSKQYVCQVSKRFASTSSGSSHKTTLIHCSRVSNWKHSAFLSFSAHLATHDLMFGSSAPFSV